MVSFAVAMHKVFTITWGILCPSDFSILIFLDILISNLSSVVLFPSYQIFQAPTVRRGWPGSYLITLHCTANICFYLQYSEMEGNPICIQIPWYKKPEQLAAWGEGRTGYPFIDACMRQLKKVSQWNVACGLIWKTGLFSWKEYLWVKINVIYIW